jgi:hypothetical protein
VDAPTARLLDARTVAHMAVAITEHLLSLEDPGAADRLVREARASDV